MVSFTNHYNDIFTDRLPSKNKLEKIHGALTLIRLGFLTVVFPGEGGQFNPGHISRCTCLISI